MKAPDWTKIKAEYLAGGTSYRKLAEKHGVSFNTLKDRAKVEAWAAQAKQVHHKVTTELPAVVAGQVLDEAASWVVDTLAMARLLKLRIEAALDPKAKQQLWATTKDGPVPLELPMLNKTQDLKQLADTLAKVDDIGRRSLGLDDDSLKSAADQDWDGALDELDARAADGGDSEASGG